MTTGIFDNPPSAPVFATTGLPRQTSLYAVIAALLRRAIVQGAIAQGAVILEGPVAKILDCTRTPVRQALQELEKEGLISRFEGRGFVAGPAGSLLKRTVLTPEMLGVQGSIEPLRKAPGWEAIHGEVERDLIHLSVFGSYRINELELARHSGVGRVVARDVLLRLESVGLLEKDERQRWVVIPLNALRIGHLYELRWLLEPVAMCSAATLAPSSETQAMASTLQQAMRDFPAVSRIQMDAMEHDLHVRFLSHCPNKELLQTLNRTRCTLTLSKHVFGVLAPMPVHDPFISEHLCVLEAVLSGDTAQAQALLKLHLERSSCKLIERVARVQQSSEAPKLAYIA